MNKHARAARLLGTLCWIAVVLALINLAFLLITDNVVHSWVALSLVASGLIGEYVRIQEQRKANELEQS